MYDLQCLIRRLKMYALSTITILFQLFLAMDFCSDVKAYCSICTIGRTVCTTSPVEPFPLNLNPNTTALEITYKGEDAFTLTEKMVSRYRYLRALTVNGNLSSIKNNTFASSDHLQRLIISQSRLKSFPDNAFGVFSSLKDLLLPRNPLMEHIPTNIFPSLRRLVYLDLSYNNFNNICKADSIGDEFRRLPTMKGLSLAGLGNSADCKNIGENFFLPLIHIQQLNLSESAFFHGVQTILKPLTNLTDLEIYNIEPFNECPRLAGDLFGNLSSSIKYIQARSWRTNEKRGPNCTITEATLKRLAHLRHLSTLDFEYGDGIFGSTLQKGLFQALPQLRQLHLGWCRITEIENGALSGLHLTNLELTGNPLGNQEFWVNGRNLSMNTTDLVVLKQCTITAEDNFPFYADFIIRNFPALLTLDLSKNIMNRLPTFIKSGSLYTSKLKLKINLHSNILHLLLKREVNDLCQAFPHLDALDLSNNYLTVMETMCTSLTDLRLNENKLYTDTKTNFETIKLLYRLTHLDLSGNSLTSIPADLFNHMSELKSLGLINNLLSSIDNQQFVFNPRIYNLDLSKNSLVNFPVTALANNTRLKYLSLNTNKISIFDKSFIHFIDSAPRLKTLRIDNNSFDCSCDQLYFQEWANTSSKVMYADQLVCSRPHTLRGKQIILYEQPIFDCYFKWALVGLAALVGLVATVLVVYRLRWYLAHLRFAALSVAERLVDIKWQDQCKYDAMVIFNSKSDDDTNWVKKLMIELEGGDYPQPINLNKPDGRVRCRHMDRFIC